MLGGRHGPRFPGDPRVPNERKPPIPRENRSPAQNNQPGQVESMKQTAFPYGEAKLPVAGYLYFPFRKKLTSIKRLELLYKGPAGEAVLRLK